jgi:simple sugar transport system ATP-binding protein
MRDFDVRARDDRISVRALSGGNQQKLVLARELSDRPTLIVAENPTRGLDVRATGEIRRRLRAARDAGAAVVFYSSDLDELAADSDRVLAVYSGSVRACELSRDAIGRAMLGAV